MEFREKSRQEAEKISADTNNHIKQEAFVRQAEIEQADAETKSKTLMFKANQTLSVNQNKAKIEQKESELAIERHSMTMKQQTEIKKAYFEHEKQVMTLESEKQKLQVQNEIAQEEENAKLTRVRAIQTQLEIDDELKAQEKREMMKLKLMGEEYKTKTAGYTPQVMQAKVLETTERVYEHLGISNMSVINCGSGGQDSAGQLISQMFASYKAITGEMDKKM